MASLSALPAVSVIATRIRSVTATPSAPSRFVACAARCLGVSASLEGVVKGEAGLRAVRRHEPSVAPHAGPLARPGTWDHRPHPPCLLAVEVTDRVHDDAAAAALDRALELLEADEPRRAVLLVGHEPLDLTGAGQAARELLGHARPGELAIALAFRVRGLVPGGDFELALQRTGHRDALLLRESCIYSSVRRQASNARCVTTHRLLPSVWRTRGKNVQLGTFGRSLLARPAPCPRGSGGVVRARHRRRSSSPPSCRTRCTETPRRPPATAPDPVPSPARP